MHEANHPQYVVVEVVTFEKVGSFNTPKQAFSAAQEFTSKTDKATQTFRSH